MKSIKLTKDNVTIIDDGDFINVSRFRWCSLSANGKTYACRGVVNRGRSKTILMHREIMGITSSNIHVDHINGNTLDNRRENLRVCTHKQNIRNSNKRYSHSSSAYKGVCKRSNVKKWHAYIVVDGSQKFLGSYAYECDAAKAYNKAAKDLFGEFARLNVIPEPMPLMPV